MNFIETFVRLAKNPEISVVRGRENTVQFVPGLLKKALGPRKYKSFLRQMGYYGFFKTERYSKDLEYTHHRIDIWSMILGSSVCERWSWRESSVPYMAWKEPSRGEKRPAEDLCEPDAKRTCVRDVETVCA